MYNLQQLYEKCALYTDETIGNPPYTGDTLTIINKFKDGINYAYRKIAREKWKPIHSENVTVDSNGRFNYVNLTYEFNDVDKIIDNNGNEIYWKYYSDSLIECPTVNNNTVTIFYYYIPNELSDITDIPVIRVSPEILSYMGAFQYFNIENDPQATQWLALFNEEYDKIYKHAKRRVKRVYSE